MPQGARLGSVVMFVQELDRSVSFYAELLGLEVADHSQTATLLVSGTGSQLILRAMHTHGSHTPGSVGIQYVVWTAASGQDLDRCEQVLKNRAAHVERRTSGGYDLVEGRDPDNIVVMIGYPGPDQLPLHELPARIYGW
jgi:catechol-2,3-dioxygenase